MQAEALLPKAANFAARKAAMDEALKQMDLTHRAVVQVGCDVLQPPTLLVPQAPASC